MGGIGYERYGRHAFKDCLLYKATYRGAGEHYFRGYFDGNIVDDLLPNTQYPGPNGTELSGGPGPDCMEWLPKLSKYFMIFEVTNNIEWKTFLFDPVLSTMTYVS